MKNIHDIFSFWTIYFINKISHSPYQKSSIHESKSSINSIRRVFCHQKYESPHWRARYIMSYYAQRLEGRLIWDLFEYDSFRFSSHAISPSLLICRSKMDILKKSKADITNRSIFNEKTSTSAVKTHRYVIHFVSLGNHTHTHIHTHITAKTQRLINTKVLTAAMC